MREGNFEKHIRRIRKIYSRKNEILILSLKKIFGDDVDIVGQETGLNILVKFNGIKRKIDENTNWNNNNMTLTPLDYYYYSKKDIKKTKYFLLSYAGVSDEEIENNIEKLREWIKLDKKYQKL
jgi:GntR family transcriptional regulator/MocR family aminotransferase